jgi:simple sugar transport system permease protein
MNDRPLPAWATALLIPAINLALAFLASGIVVLIAGQDPLRAMQVMATGAFGSGEALGWTLYYATSFIFTGLAVAVAFHAGLFNIGGEGQAMLGGLGAALVALWLGDSLPWWAVLPVATLAAALFGMTWALPPAWAQARRGSHIVITTIMFNFIASTLLVYLLVNVLIVPGRMAPQSRRFGDGGQIPDLRGLFAALGLDSGSSPVNVTLFLALLAAAAVWVLIWRTRLGYEIRAVGHAPAAAANAGIDPARIILIAMGVSGALAGAMALNPVLGEAGRLKLDFTLGAGFVGIAVALMGRGHPAGILPAALLFGALYQGGAALSFEMPGISRNMVAVIQALVILFTGALENMTRPLVQRLIAAPIRRA